MSMSDPWADVEAENDPYATKDDLRREVHRLRKKRAEMVGLLNEVAEMAHRYHGNPEVGGRLEWVDCRYEPCATIRARRWGFLN